MPKADWEATPPSIQALVLALSERLTQIEEKLNKNSRNSSKPPSSDGFEKSVEDNKKGRKRASGQRQSAPRQMRQLKPIEACDWVEEIKPAVCGGCGAPLQGEDPRPHRHQEIELPPIAPLVTEYRLHQLVCDGCGQATRASLPVGFLGLRRTLERHLVEWALSTKLSSGESVDGRAVWRATLARGYRSAAR